MVKISDVEPSFNMPQIIKNAVVILLRFKAIDDRKHFSLTAAMPIFFIFARQCSLLRTAKLP